MVLEAAVNILKGIHMHCIWLKLIKMNKTNPPFSRDIANKALNATGQENINIDTLFQV